MKIFIAIILIVLLCVLTILISVAPPYSFVYYFLWDGIVYNGEVYYPTSEQPELSSFFSGEVEVHLVYKDRIYYEKTERALKYQGDESCEFLYYNSGTYKKSEI